VEKIIKFLLYQINGLFPFIYEALPMFKSFNFIRGPFSYLKDYISYGSLSQKQPTPFALDFWNTRPMLYDRFEKAGEIPKHYFYQDIWAARKVYESKVSVHYDIGSRLNGFISHCVVFTKVVMLDVRPLSIKLDNLEFVQTDATNMNNIESNSIESLSSLHAIEHFGLGRYGDPVDPQGYIKAIREIGRILKKDGNVYFSAPVGKQRLEFNAHRIFDPKYIIELFSGLELKEFSYIDDNENLIVSADIKEVLNQNYSCGLFYFKKKSVK